MTRHVRHTWRRTAAYTAVSTLLGADAALATIEAVRDRSAMLFVGAVALAYISVVALAATIGYVGGASLGAGRAAWTRWRRAGAPAIGRTRLPGFAPGLIRRPAAAPHSPAATASPADIRIANAWLHRFTAEVVDGEQPDTETTVMMQPVPTVPMPVEDLAATGQTTAGGAR